MNFLKGEVRGGACQVADIALPLPAGSSGGDGTRIVYGIRPEHWTIDESGVPAVVHLVEPTGSETQVTAHVGGTPVICAFRERVAARPGETIRIAPDPRVVHLFDEGSGTRLN
jgi:multiple sugar transport system ATP-binding protein